MKKSLGFTAIWTALSTAMKIAVGLLLVKLFSLQFGAEGLGQASNFMTLITVLGVFAGAGIFNGVTKYVAEYEKTLEKTGALLGTASRIIVLFSALLGLIFILFASPISQWLFYSAEYKNVVIATAILQFGIALSNYFLAILKGYRNAKANALAIIIGTLLGVLIFVGGLYAFGYQGALIGLVAMPALVFLPAGFFLKEQTQLPPWRQMIGAFDKAQARQLLKFSIMVFITTVTLPLGYVLLRDLLVANYSLESLGLWQGVSKISDAYLQFITATFSVYLLPTFAKLQDKKSIQKEVFRSLKFVAVAVIVISSLIFLLRHWVVLILYSEQFLPMQDLFQWQLIGDVFKVLAYIFGYLIVAKGALKLYALAELSQFALLVGTGYWLIPNHGALGATQAYCITYFSYFVCCLLGFIYYQKRAKEN